MKTFSQTCYSPLNSVQVRAANPAVFYAAVILSNVYLFQSIFVLDGNTLKQTQFDGKGFESTIDREFTDGELIAVSSELIWDICRNGFWP